MIIEIKKPELEALIQKRLENSQFLDLDELLTKALEALPESNEHGLLTKPRKRLIDVLTSPPFAGSELKIDRLPECSQPPIEL